VIPNCIYISGFRRSLLEADLQNNPKKILILFLYKQVIFESVIERHATPAGAKLVSWLEFTQINKLEK